MVSTYGAFDGLPVGEYAVTVEFDGRYGVGGEEDLVPAAYTKPETTPLRATIKSGKNELTLDVKTLAESPPMPRPVDPKATGPKESK